MCYAALIQTDNFIVPYRIAVDSYVLAELNPNTNEAGDIYYELDSEQIQVLQQEQQLPNPTPTHEIGMGTYLPALGLLALVVAWLVWQIKAGKPPSKAASPPPTQQTTRMTCRSWAASTWRMTKASATIKARITTRSTTVHAATAQTTRAVRIPAATFPAQTISNQEQPD